MQDPELADVPALEGGTVANAVHAELFVKQQRQKLYGSRLMVCCRKLLCVVLLCSCGASVQTSAFSFEAGNPTMQSVSACHGGHVGNAIVLTSEGRRPRR
ncbi:unnamed protein product [Symbiodinium natans]|uniref:Uncharacterized protein n=1 Tax=Symbiodinium natans TaxID=878477 RepID=A0A812RUQ1_9DINO|nr:unnamed protein product [Symbiodinium natans]